MAIKVQAVISAWKSFKLTEAQHQLDETATVIASEQDKSESSKKKLVELSREFKKSTPEDVRKEVSPLLKCFQQEIDNLNKRSKYAENAFLNVYKQFIEMTDPLPVLEYCAGLEKKVGRMADLEIENKNLRETLQEYNNEFKEVRNQDVTIKTLKEKLKQHDENFDSIIESKTKELEKELTKDYAEKERLLQEMQESMSKRLKETETNSHILRQTLDQTQSELFEYKSRFDEANAARTDEIDILVNDCERANNRAIAAEKEIVQLKEQIQNLSMTNSPAVNNVDNMGTNIENSSDMLSRSFLEIEVASKEKEINQLVEDHNKLQLNYEKYKVTMSKKVQDLEQAVEQNETLIGELQDEIMKKEDYDEIKRELNVIKSIEFGGESQSRKLSTQQKTLEVLLLEKNKALQNDNTLLKQSNIEIENKLSDSEKELTSMKLVVSEQKGIIIQLEKDLSSVHTLSSLYRGEGEGSPSMPAIVAEAVRASVNETPPPYKVENEISCGSPPDFTSAAESLLPIVSAQRERFRQRNEELEADATIKGQQVVLLQNELDTLRADNLKLYEKIRFLQSYRGQESSSNSTAESRYSSQYEEGLDPFSSFSRKEKSRKYAALSPFEKITLSMGQFILSNKTARAITFFYTMMVHCLIFLVLYKLVHTESCKRDFASDCAEKFAEHMQQVHGDNDLHNHIIKE